MHRTSSHLLVSWRFPTEVLRAVRTRGVTMASIAATGLGELALSSANKERVNMRRENCVG